MLTAFLQRAIRPVVEQSLGAVIAEQHRRREQEFASVERLRGLAVSVGLQHLFNQGHFSIVQLEQCLTAARVIPDGEVIRILRPLHCIDYRDMPAELRDQVFTLVMRMFGAADAVRAPGGGA